MVAYHSEHPHKHYLVTYRDGGGYVHRTFGPAEYREAETLAAEKGVAVRTHWVDGDYDEEDR